MSTSKQKKATTKSSSCGSGSGTSPLNDESSTEDVLEDTATGPILRASIAGASQAMGPGGIQRSVLRRAATDIDNPNRGPREHVAGLRRAASSKPSPFGFNDPLAPRMLQQDKAPISARKKLLNMDIQLFNVGKNKDDGTTLGSTALAQWSKRKTATQTVNQSVNLMDIEAGAKQPYRRSVKPKSKGQRKKGPMEGKAIEYTLLVAFPLLMVAVAVPAVLFLVWPKIQEAASPHAAHPTEAPSPSSSPGGAQVPTVETPVTTEEPKPESAFGAILPGRNNPDNATDALVGLVGDGISSGFDKVSESLSKSKGNVMGPKAQSLSITNPTQVEQLSTGTVDSTNGTHPVKQPHVPGFSIADDERWLDLKRLIVRHQLSSEDEFNNPQSSAYKALEWIVSYDETLEVISSDMAWSLLENYALTVFYFATHPHAKPRDAKRTSLSTPHSIGSTVDWLHQINKDICHWHGVRCGHLHRVVDMNLTHCGLAGTLPSELVGLTHLINLDLSNNHIAGTLPPEWSELSFLRLLSLADNKLEGPVPESWRNLSDQLEILDLNQNHLSGTIPAIISGSGEEEEGQQT